MDNQYESFEKKKFLYFVTGLVVVFIVGLGYTWSIVQTPIVQAMGGESVTATVALCYTVTVLCSTMSPTLFGAFTKPFKRFVLPPNRVGDMVEQRTVTV